MLRIIAILLLVLVSEATWMETVVEISFNGSLEYSYDLYKQLDQHPTWSPWLKEVKYNSNNESISSWTLSSLGLTFSWEAETLESYEPYVVSWKSITGLPNTGRVEFSSNLIVCRYSLEDSERTENSDRYCGPISDLTMNDKNNNNELIHDYDSVDKTNSDSALQDTQEDEIVHMKVIVRYDMPDVAARVLNWMGSIGKGFIINTIYKDLERFRDRVQRELISSNN